MERLSLWPRKYFQVLSHSRLQRSQAQGAAAALFPSRCSHSSAPSLQCHVCRQHRWRFLGESQYAPSSGALQAASMLASACSGSAAWRQRPLLQAPPRGPHAGGETYNNNITFKRSLREGLERNSKEKRVEIKWRA
ncbi:hypothetical protein GQ54DRAFT_33009 [Martensiomyces pterosporus]|nr:hypothetical protein GQ54DRAFT_33009 [Martensiomyces pterosporus]